MPRCAVSHHLERLKRQIDQVVDLPGEEWAFAARHYRSRQYPPGAYLLEAGELAVEDFWIASGLVRLYYLSDDGRERTKGFAGTGRVVGCYSSRLLRRPADFSIQALEQTSVLALPAEIADQLPARHPAWERLRRLIAERLFLEKERREREFLIDSPASRYLQFLQQHGELADRVPGYHVAAYLGITPVALSRIRRRLISAGELTSVKASAAPES